MRSAPRYEPAPLRGAPGRAGRCVPRSAGRQPPAGGGDPAGTQHSSAPCPQLRTARLQGEGPGRPLIRAAGFPSPLIRCKRFNYCFATRNNSRRASFTSRSRHGKRGAPRGSVGVPRPAAGAPPCVCVCVCRGGSPLPAPRHNPQKVAARRKSRILPEPRPPGWRAAVAKGHQREGGAPGALLPLPRRLAPRSGAPGASLPACPLQPRRS